MSVDPLAVREKNNEGWLGSFIYLLGVDVVLVVQMYDQINKTDSPQKKDM